MPDEENAQPRKMTDDDPTLADDEEYVEEEVLVEEEVEVEVEVEVDEEEEEQAVHAEEIGSALEQIAGGAQTSRPEVPDFGTGASSSRPEMPVGFNAASSAARTRGPRPMRKTKGNDALKTTSIPILFTVGILLLVPAIWAVRIKSGSDAWGHEREDASTMANIMLVCWPVAIALIAAGFIFLIQHLSSKKKTEAKASAKPSQRSAAPKQEAPAQQPPKSPPSKAGKRPAAPRPPKRPPPRPSAP